MWQSLPLRAVVSKGICSCHWKLFPSHSFLHSMPFIWCGMWYCQFNRYHIVFTRMFEGICHSCTIGELPIGGSLGWKMTLTISPWTSLVIFKSASMLSVTITFILIAGLTLCARSFDCLLCVCTVLTLSLTLDGWGHLVTLNNSLKSSHNILKFYILVSNYILDSLWVFFWLKDAILLYA